MKPKQRNHRDGILSRTIRNVFGSELIEGQRVYYCKKKVYDEKNLWTGEYEYHYHDTDYTILIRMSKLLIMHT